MQHHILRFPLFSMAILFYLLAFNGTNVLAVAHEFSADNEFDNSLSAYSYLGKTEMIDFVSNTDGTGDKVLSDIITITPDTVTNIKLTTATIGATITPVGSTAVLASELSFSNVPTFSGTGNWDDATKWSVQDVPGIVAGNNAVVVAGDSIVIVGNCTINNLTINAGAKVTVNTGGILTVNGTLINNNGAAGLIIKSDGSNPNGTLTFVNGSPKATVEMYSLASWGLKEPSGSKYSWQYFGIPVKTFPFNNTFSDCYVRQYNKAATGDVDLWISQSADSLTSGIGYEIVQQSPKTYVFTGQLTNADFYRVVDYIPGTTFPGQNIFANPYTAAIDIKKIQFGANTENSVYLYNTGSYNQSLVQNLDNPAGQYTVSTLNTAGTSGVPAQIPSMQGFLMKTSNQNSGSFTINYVNSIVSNTDPQRAPGIKQEVLSDKVVTRIDLSGNHYTDCMWIFSDSTCSNKFDNGWDGYKIQGSIEAPQLYAMESDGNYQIDAVADINGTCLGFNAGQDSLFKLTFTHQNTNLRYTGLYLVDLQENKTIDITASGSEYSFTAVSTPTPVQRFKIVASSQVDTYNIPVKSTLLKVFTSNGTVFIQNQSDKTGELILYNMSGVAVNKTAFKSDSITTFSTSNLVPGVYVAKACANQENVTEKIIIR